MSFNLDAALRIASVTIAEDVKTQLANLAKGVDFGKGMFKGIDEGALTSVTGLSQRLTNANSRMTTLAETTAVVSAKIVQEIGKAGQAIDNLIGKLEKIGGTGGMGQSAAIGQLGPAIVNILKMQKQLEAALAKTSVAGKPKVAVDSGTGEPIPKITGFAAGAGKGIKADMGTVPTITGFYQAKKAVQELGQAVKQAEADYEKLGDAASDAASKAVAASKKVAPLKGQGTVNPNVDMWGIPKPPPPTNLNSVYGAGKGKGYFGSGGKGSGTTDMWGVPLPPPPGDPNSLGGYGAGATGRVGSATLMRGGALIGNNISSQLRDGSRAANDFADAMVLAGRRYAAFVLATSAPFVAIGALREGAKDVIEFDASITRLGQILDTTGNELGSIRKQILDLSVATGTSAADLTQAAVTMAQAGIRGDALRASLEALSKVPLLPSFESVDQAAQGMIAVFGQFKLEASDVSALMDKLNEGANEYAVTSQDLFEATKRGGATFKALGGNLDEFLALMTATKQTSQESMDSIATGWRTVFGRMTRPETRDFLKTLGINTEDEGKLVSIYRILEQTSKVFAASDEIQKQAIAEKLGGSRQIGRVIPVLSDFDLVNKALTTYRVQSIGSVQRDVEAAAGTMAKHIERLRAQANALIQDFAPDIFNPFVNGMTAAATAALILTQKLEPLLKVMLALGGAMVAIKGLEVVASLAGRLSVAGAVAPAATDMWGMSRASAGSAGLMAWIGGAYAGGRGKGLQAAGQRLGLAEDQQAVAPGFFQNPVVQLGMAAGVAALFDTLADSLKEADHQMGAAAASWAEAVTVIIAATALLRNQSMYQLGGDVAGGLRGLGLGGGVAAGGAMAGLAGLLFLGIRDSYLQESIQKKINEVGDKIAAIPVPDASKQDKVRQASDELITATLGAIDDTVKTYEGIGGWFNALGHRVHQFITGDWGKSLNPNAPSVDGEDIMRQMFGKNPRLMNAQLELSIRAGGSDWYNTLRKGLTEQFKGKGMAYPEQLADTAAKMMVELTGGMAGVSERMKKVADDMRNARLAEEASRAAKSLAEVIVPPTLAGQLLNLGKAVESASNAVKASIGAYEAQAGGVTPGSIAAPRLPTAVEGEAAKKLMASGALSGLVTSRPGLQQYVQQTYQMEEMARSFVNAIGQAQEEAVAYNKDLKPGQQRMEEPMSMLRLQEGATEEQIQQSRDALDKLITQFLDKNPVPAKVRDMMQLLLRDIGEAMAQGMELRGNGFNTKVLKDIIGKRLAPVVGTGEEISGLAQQELQARFSHMQARGDLQASILNMEVGRPRTAESQYATNRRFLEQAGIPIQGGRTNSLTDIVTDTTLLDRLGQASSTITGKLADNLQMLFKAAATGETTDSQGRVRTIQSLMEEMDKLRTEALGLQAAIASTKKTFDEFQPFIEERIVKQKEAGDLYNELWTKQREMGETLRLGGSGPAWREQQEKIQRAMAAMQEPMDIAQSIMHGPKEGNREASIALQESLARAYAKMSAYYDDIQRIENTKPDYAKDQTRGLTDRFKDALDQMQRYTSKGLDISAKLETEKYARLMQELQEKLADIGINNQKILGEKAGLGDPFGATTFNKAVSDFDKAVTRLLNSLAVPPAPEKFTTRNGVSKPVMSQFGTPESMNPLERAAFGGMSKGDIIMEASKYLTGPEAPSKRVTDMPVGYAVPSSRIVPGPRSLGELRKAPAEERDSIINGIMARIKESQPGVDSAAEKRIRQYLVNPDMGQIEFDAGAVRDYQNRAGFDAAMSPPSQAPTVGPGPTTRPVPMSQPAPDIDLYSMQIPSVFQDFVPARSPNEAIPQTGGVPTTAPQGTGAVGSAEEILKIGAEIGKQVEQAIMGALDRLQIPGLNENASATKDNADALKRIESTEGQLAGSLERTADAIAQGVALKLEGLQKIDVQVNGLTERISDELVPVIEQVAVKATKDILHKALLEMAGASDSEGARPFMTAARGLA